VELPDFLFEMSAKRSELPKLFFVTLCKIQSAKFAPNALMRLRGIGPRYLVRKNLKGGQVAGFSVFHVEEP
jgi:hypothetical protein